MIGNFLFYANNKMDPISWLLFVFQMKSFSSIALLFVFKFILVLLYAFNMSLQKLTSKIVN